MTLPVRPRPARRLAGDQRRSQGVAPPRPEEGDPPVVPTQRSAAHPGHLSQGAELVEEARLVARHAGRQDVALQDRGRDRHAGQLVDDLRQALEGSLPAQRRRDVRAERAGHRRRRHPLPGGQEAGQRGRLHRLHLAAQPRQRAAAQEPQDVRVAPLTLGATGPELAAQERPGLHEPRQRLLDDAEREPPATRRLGGQEGPVGPCPAGQEPAKCVARLAEERGRRPRRRLGAGGVAVAGGVLDGDPARLAGDPQHHGPTGGGQGLEPLPRGRRPAPGPRGDLVGGEIAEPAQEVGHLVDRARLALVHQGLPLQLGRLERLRVEQLA